MTSQGWFYEKLCPATPVGYILCLKSENKNLPSENLVRDGTKYSSQTIAKPKMYNYISFKQLLLKIVGLPRCLGFI